MSKFTILPLFFLVTFYLCTVSFSSEEENDVVMPQCCGFSTPLLIKKDERREIVATEFGEISAVEVGDGCGGGVIGPYHIHFITLEPNALLLPILLHSDMVFFVHSGSGIMNWVDEEKERNSEIRRGDVYRLRPGTVLYLQSKPVDVQFGDKLRVYAIFSNSQECLHDPCFGPYSSIRELMFGFDESILQSAFAVPKEVIESIRNRTKPPLITKDTLRNKTEEEEENNNKWQLETRFLKLFTGDETSTITKSMAVNKKKKSKKAKTFNLFESEPDFENCNGRSIEINRKDLKVLKGSSFGVFMVNLTEGSMMGPHWNPYACEISIVLKGSGMVRVIRSSKSSKNCENSRFRVEEGDVFAIPKFHPVAEMSFNDEELVFMGFMNSAKRNDLQFLAGKSSVLRVLDRDVLGVALNISNVTVSGLLGAQKEEVLLKCVSCAEMEFEKLEVEMEMKRREEERKREEEAAAEEEEERRRREEEEEKKWPPEQPQPPQPFQPFQGEEMGEWEAGGGVEEERAVDVAVETRERGFE